ncbi:VOC family protein [Arsenicicoccus dermatophilus]|uniref:VOC family protein n=1 Tax=Arsenicicoccus dermatophilus TaxID=1076331 RepID=UPI001F4CBFCF|nr:VOC family protein [Arsenicicoccus dermatophilus]MCH8613823.1 VOC family protein [Arsenicicoccus dermatophilus]
MSDPLLRYQCLVMDACDPATMGEFWSCATGLVAQEQDGQVVLRDDAPAEERDPARRIWLEPVPEPRSAKNRVHLDVHTRDVADLVRAGATPVVDRGWTVLRDPEGGELCAFGRTDERADGYRVYELVVDCADPEAEVRWWSRHLGGEPGHDPEHPWWWLCPPGLPFESVVFVPVPEPKVGKDRVHWDLTTRPGTSPAEAAAELVRDGATVLRAGDEEQPWWVLASPEGHEFCVFAG